MLWVRAGTGKFLRNLALHELATLHGTQLCSVLLAVHHLTGADYTSKVGTKLAALEVTPENYLIGFGSSKMIYFGAYYGIIHFLPYMHAFFLYYK